MPTHLVWVTDPHLNHASLRSWEHWTRAVSAHHGDGVVITGDISEGDDVVFQLKRIADELSMPIHFVLGNHDFYHSSIGRTRAAVIAASRENPRLSYLTDCGPIQLADGAYLIGEDGWGDATRGDYENSLVRLNDFVMIEDFSMVDPGRWKQLLIDQGAESAGRLAEKIRQLPADTKQVVIATHVPPFCEACWYEGHTTDENWAPFFVCGLVGDALRQASGDRPDCQFTVLCGHTHHEGIATVNDNLVVYTGKAEYGSPEVEGLVVVKGEEVEIQLKRA